MEKFKSIAFIHFEKIVVLMILFLIMLITLFVPYKIGFLNFFYLPIILAGYFAGKKTAVLTSLFCILLIALFILISPSSFFIPGLEKTFVIISLLAWSSFLILTSAAMGYLYDERKKKIGDLKSAYVGILEILAKYLESADKYTQGHSVRVSHMSDNIAQVMGLSSYERENIRTAARLHDIGKIEISMDILQKAASLTKSEKETMDTHSQKGAKLISLVGGVLEDAVPIILAHHKFHFEKNGASQQKREEIPLGAEIIAVADAYDAMITDRPYRAGLLPWKAFREIEKESGRQFHPGVVSAFKKVLVSNKNYRMEENINS